MILKLKLKSSLVVPKLVRINEYKPVRWFYTSIGKFHTEIFVHVMRFLEEKNFVCCVVIGWCQWMMNTVLFSSCISYICVASIYRISVKHLINCFNGDHIKIKVREYFKIQIFYWSRYSCSQPSTWLIVHNVQYIQFREFSSTGTI